MVEPKQPIGLLPLFLPPIAWWAAARNRSVALDRLSRYRPQTELHRCTIKAAGGTLLLIVPVVRESKYSSVNEARIDNRRDWSRPLRQSLRSAYGKAPFFLYYSELIDEIHSTERLIELNIRLIRWVYRALKWSETSLTDSADYIDCRFVGIRGGKPPGFQPLNYWQQFGPFTSNLSIVDALFQVGPQLDAYLGQCLPNNPEQGLQVFK